MPPQLDPISVRTARLNNIILGKGVGVSAKPATGASSRRSIVPVSTTSAALAETVCREGLLDAFCLLYNECDKDSLKKRDRNIAEFVNKCESQISSVSGCMEIKICLLLLSSTHRGGDSKTSSECR